MARNNTQQTPILNISTFSSDPNANARILQENFARNQPAPTPNPNNNLVTTTRYDPLGNVLMQPDPAGMKYLYGNADTDGAAAHDLATRNGWLQGPGYIIIPYGESVDNTTTTGHDPDPVIPIVPDPVIPIVPDPTTPSEKLMQALPADMVALLAQRFTIPHEYGTNFLDAANPGNAGIGAIGAGLAQGGIDQLYTALKRNQIARDLSTTSGNIIGRDSSGRWYTIEGNRPRAISPHEAFLLTMAKANNTYNSTRNVTGGLQNTFTVLKKITGLPQGGGNSSITGTPSSSSGAAQSASEVQDSMRTLRS